MTYYFLLLCYSIIPFLILYSSLSLRINKIVEKYKAYVLLVLLGFDVATFTPIAYQRDRLSRHLKVN